MILLLTHSRSYIDTTRILDLLSATDIDDEQHVHRFEEAMARYIGAKIAFGTNQARAALLIGLKALGIQQGDEVIVQSFTYRGVMDTIIEAGARPILVTNSTDDLNTTASEIEKRCTDRTRCILATHLFGNPCEVEEIIAVAKRRNIPVIEDCAQCLGPLYHGKKTGSMGDLAIFSFNFDKHMSTGEGGLLAVNNDQLIEPVRRIIGSYQRVDEFNEKCYVYGLLVQHIATGTRYFEPSWDAYFGQNSCKNNPALFRELDAIMTRGTTPEAVETIAVPHIEKEKRNLHPPMIVRGMRGVIRMLKAKMNPPRLATVDAPRLLMGPRRAAVGLAALSKLDEVNNERTRRARLYREGLEGNPAFLLPKEDSRKTPAFLRYCVLNKSPTALPTIIRRSRQAGINIGNFQWPIAVHMLEPYRSVIPHRAEELEASAFIATHIVNLPVHAYVSDADIRRAMDLMNEFTKQ